MTTHGRAGPTSAWWRPRDGARGAARAARPTVVTRSGLAAALVITLVTGLLSVPTRCTCGADLPHEHALLAVPGHSHSRTMDTDHAARQRPVRTAPSAARAGGVDAARPAAVGDAEPIDAWVHAPAPDATGAAPSLLLVSSADVDDGRATPLGGTVTVPGTGRAAPPDSPPPQGRMPVSHRLTVDRTDWLTG